MALRTFVKVGSVSNLSDARYCAGMGVDLLGFCTVPGQEDYIRPSTFQEIRGWVTGPQIVAEIYGIQNERELSEILEGYKPDFLEMSPQELSRFTRLTIPYILSIDDVTDLESISIMPAYLISKTSFHTSTPLLVRVQSTADVHPLLQNAWVKGLALKGGAELKPGLKDYEVINEVLELLETDD